MKVEIVSDRFNTTRVEELGQKKMSGDESKKHEAGDGKPWTN
jgi:hypothetical protein